MEALRFSQISDHDKYDLILADPPFFKDDIYKVSENLKINKFLNDSGFIIIERSIQTKENDISNLGTEPFKIIGDTCLYEI
jgi:16S rRNA (guanine966-N2)-methyltransferase